MDKFMKIAFGLAKKADPHPNPKVGAVLVKNGKIIGVGYHKKPGLPHAEIEAINDAKNKRHMVKGAILYVTLEPCSHLLKRTPPCTNTIIDNKIGSVIYAMKDPNPLVGAGDAFRRSGIRIIGPTDQEQGERLNKKYIGKVARKPFVIIKMAMSADGKTATRTGDAKWISSPQSLLQTHKMRSNFDAIMVGAGTVIRDSPRLTARIKNGRNPYRIIVDGRLSIPLKSKVLIYKDNKTVILVSGNAPKNKIKKITKRKKGHVVVCGKGEVDLKKAMKILSAVGIRSVMIEGGSELNASAIKAKIVDRIILFVAPKIIGGKDAKPVIGGLGIAKMSQSISLTNMKYKKIGSDLMVQFDIQK
ncbi:bifunctional diaminohydroxyphosphoribosylaminopyrimidine deaminase/5-amino-6-(5-phosphoribosylamino)uracil reductase RibD [Candidatus Micrarchaeota archaeon]|nr:bifunctional diaminohydroxyphosphoribosylaminopyrimidine deaminase/5-amino-6-(5-phosphoribosylamino)uracil reductase RibD [Candidatus Micrarchaeota archaeon]